MEGKITGPQKKDDVNLYILKRADIWKSDYFQEYEIRPQIKEEVKRLESREKDSQYIDIDKKLVG